jgi:hypothetical protein
MNNKVIETLILKNMNLENIKNLFKGLKTTKSLKVLDLFGNTHLKNELINDLTEIMS